MTLTAAPVEGQDRLRLVWDHTDRAGIYRFHLRRLDGEREIRLAAVNVDPRESDLAAADEQMLRRTLAPLPFEYVRGAGEIGEATEEGRTELWRLTVALALLVLMTEHGLAWWWGRR